MAASAPGRSPPGSPGVITVVTAVQRQVDEVEEQLAALNVALNVALTSRGNATLRHLEMLDAAAQGLEVSAKEAAVRRDELLVSAGRLALELRGLDLLAGHVKSVDELVRRLEVQAADVIATAGRS